VPGVNGANAVVIVFAAFTMAGFLKYLEFGPLAESKSDFARFVNEQITNSEGLGLDQISTSNRGLFRRGNHIAWIADVPGAEDNYVALFNTGEKMDTITAVFQDMGLSGATYKIRDLWTRKDMGGFKREFCVPINPHGAGLYRLLA